MAAQVTFASKHNTALFSNSYYQNLFISRPIVQLCFYNAIWAVKISFLIFFRRIGVTALPAVRRYWTIVFIVTVASYFAVWLLNPYGCWVKKGWAACDTDRSVNKLMPVSLSLATMFDIVTDGLIVAIPFAVLSYSQLSGRQKLVLYAVFSFGLIIVLVAIVRIVLAARGVARDRMFHTTLLIFLSQVEANTGKHACLVTHDEPWSNVCLAIVAACVGTLRTLFTQKDDRTGSSAPRVSRPSANSVTRPQRAVTAFTTISSPANRISDEELALTGSRHGDESSKAFEMDSSICLGDLMKKP